MRVGCVCYGGLGDNIQVLKSLYALKNIYQCEVILFGNTGTYNLMKYVDCIGECVKIEHLNEKSAKLIVTYHCDYIILSNPGGVRCLKEVGITNIITSTRVKNLFDFHCKTVPTHLFPKYRKQAIADNLCALVRRINPKLYDSKIQTLDFSKITIPTSMQNKEFVTNFFKSLAFLPKQEQFYLIMINPFNYAATHTLPWRDRGEGGWIDLIQRVLEYSHTLSLSLYILIVTFEGVHAEFMQILKDSNISLENIIIFQNNKDILNLVEIISRVGCLICPSTGPIHVASYLRIPTIGLFSPKDTYKWATWDKQYVVIDKRADQLSIQEKENIINKTLKILHTNITNQYIMPTDKKRLTTS